VIYYVSDFIEDIDLRASAAHSVTPHRSSSPRHLPVWPTFRPALGIKGTTVTVDLVDGFLTADSRELAMRRRPPGCRIPAYATRAAQRRER